MKYFTVFVLFIFLLSLNSIELFVPSALPSLPFFMMDGCEISTFTDVRTEVIPKIIKKEEGIYLIPTNVASKLSINIDFQVEAIVYSNLLKIVSNRSDIKDLDKQKILISAPGSSPDVLAGFIFDFYKIKPEVTYFSAPQIMKMMIADLYENCVLPEPFASIVIEKNKKLKHILDFKEVWSKEVDINGIPQLALIQIGEKSSPKQIDKIIKDYNRIVMDLENKNSKKIYDKNFKIKLSSKVYNDVIKNLSLELRPAFSEKNNVILYLQKLKNNNPKSVGKIENLIE